MAAIAWMAVAVVVLGLLLWLALTGGLLGKSLASSDDPTAPTAPADESLAYRVPAGQDPAVVMAALVEHGYDATPRPAAGLTDIVVPCPGGKEEQRADVRRIIEGVHATSLEGGNVVHGDVRFVDEPEGGSPHSERR